MWLGKQGYSQVTADCDFTPLVSGEELIQKSLILLRVGSGPRYSPRYPNTSQLLCFNEMSQCLKNTERSHYSRAHMPLLWNLSNTGLKNYLYTLHIDKNNTF